MKRFLSILAFSLFIITSIAAQGNGNGGFGNNGNGNGGYGNGQGNSQWANVNWPQWLISWMENGGQVPMPLAVMVIHEAKEWGMQNFGFTQGQMLQRYVWGVFTIEFISTSPPSLTFRLRHGGGLNIVVVLDA